MSQHILVIDDDPVLLTIVRDYLEDAGFQVSTADCGVYSNHIIYGNDPPDLILLDVIMPNMSGVKKSQLIKQRDKSSEIPIILMSSKDEEELKGLAEKAMAEDFIQKPFKAETLVAKIRGLLA